MKNLFITIVCCLFCTQMQAQFGIRPFNSGNQQLIEEAVTDGLFIVRRTYQLQDTLAETPQYYGWNDEPNFGESYSLGIKTTTGYYLDDKAVHPWKYDPKFDEYRDSKQYAPVLAQSEYRPYRHPADSVFLSLPYKNVASKAIAEGQFHLVSDSIFKSKGFPTDDSDGPKAGWLVWLTSTDSLENANEESLSLLIYRSELTFEAGKSAYKIETPSTNKSVVGGFYVVPKTEEIGKITLYLIGLIDKKDGQWQIVRADVRTGFKPTRTPDDAITPQSKSKKKKLTPTSPPTP